MPSRKQRRRREKLQRHEWEEIFVDDDGRELAAEEAEELRAATAASRGAGAKDGKGRRPADRGNRRLEPPTWRRTFKRGLLFFPLMLLTIFLLAGDELSTVQKVVQTLVLMAFFLPFSYFMDSVVWRSHKRRLARAGEAKKKPS